MLYLFGMHEHSQIPIIVHAKKGPPSASYKEKKGPQIFKAILGPYALRACRAWKDGGIALFCWWISHHELDIRLSFLRCINRSIDRSWQEPIKYSICRVKHAANIWPRIKIPILGTNKAVAGSSRNSRCKHSIMINCKKEEEDVRIATNWQHLQGMQRKETMGGRYRFSNLIWPGV